MPRIYEHKFPNTKGCVRMLKFSLNKTISEYIIPKCISIRSKVDFSVRKKSGEYTAVIVIPNKGCTVKTKNIGSEIERNINNGEVVRLEVDGKTFYVGMGIVMTADFGVIAVLGYTKAKGSDEMMFVDSSYITLQSPHSADKSMVKALLTNRIKYGFNTCLIDLSSYVRVEDPCSEIRTELTDSERKLVANFVEQINIKDESE